MIRNKITHHDRAHMIEVRIPSKVCDADLSSTNPVTRPRSLLRFVVRPQLVIPSSTSTQFHQLTLCHRWLSCLPEADSTDIDFAQMKKVVCSES